MRVFWWFCCPVNSLWRSGHIWLPNFFGPHQQMTKWAFDKVSLLYSFFCHLRSQKTFSLSSQIVILVAKKSMTQLKLRIYTFEAQYALSVNCDLCHRSPQLHGQLSKESLAAAIKLVCSTHSFAAQICKALKVELSFVWFLQFFSTTFPTFAQMLAHRIGNFWSVVLYWAAKWYLSPWTIGVTGDLSRKLYKLNPANPKAIVLSLVKEIGGDLNFSIPVEFYIEQNFVATLHVDKASLNIA